MNKFLNDFYGIEVIGIIKVTNKLYRIKTKNNKYYGLKHYDNSNESIFAHISVLEIASFSLPIKNKNGHFISELNGEYYYLMDWYDDEMILAKEIKLRFYVEELIKLHSISSYETKINNGYFEDVFSDLEKIIDEEDNDINYYLSNIEKLEYKSPSEWLFLLNNNKFKNGINKARNHLKKFKDLVKNMDNMRVSLNYMNFDFANILVKDKKIIGTEKMVIAPILYDLKDLFEKSYDLSIDIIMYLRLYLKEIDLFEYEKEWLLTIISIPFVDYDINNNEINQILDLSKTIYKMNRCDEVEKILLKNNK